MQRGARSSPSSHQSNDDISLLTPRVNVAVSVDDAFRTRISAQFEGIAVFILSKEALIRNKRAVGRAQDLADLKSLEE